MSQNPFEIDKRKIAVVGNSNSEAGLGRGKIIDRFDIVIRFNNFVAGGDYATDYGTKCNAWSSSFDTSIRPRLEEFEFNLCPLPMNDEHYRKTLYTYYNDPLLESIKPLFIPMDFYKELEKFIPRPSTGLAMLWWLFKVHGKLPRENIFGFAFFSKEVKHHYFDSFSRTFHDGNAEKSIFMDMTE